MSATGHNSEEEHSTETSVVFPVDPPPFVFSPPPGGDLSIRSCDNQVFSVHSLILGLASSVFSDMSVVGTRSAEVIDLAEDSETISIMLAYIYPSGIPPPLNSFHLMEKRLAVAQKYDLKAMLQRLDRSFATESSYKSLIEYDPLRLFDLSVAYDLRESQTTAIRTVQPRHCNLLTIEKIKWLANTYPSSAPAIKLMGIQAARAEILFRFFYGDNSLTVNNITPNEENSWLICKDCRLKTITSMPVIVTYYPTWLHGWTSGVYRLFSKEPLKDHHHCFTTRMFNPIIRSRQNDPVCQLCIKAALKAKKGQVLKDWLESVEEALMDRLKELEDLLAL
ncbi:hypothetical protein FRC07_006002 [Ceratobasidium sp. 392]|nr:hypothetical protein FRC07_006002 [Ceratobasidium sp. 392]